MRRVVALLGVLGTLLLGACGETHPPVPAEITASATVDRFEAGGRRALLMTPEAGEVHGVVIYHHGASEGADSVYDPLKSEVMVRIIATGWAIAAIDAAGDNWGNEAGMAAYEALWAEVSERLAPRRAVHLSHSMGGLSALNCIATGCDVPVHAWIGIYPVTDQRTMAHTPDAAQFLPAIEQAFGGEPVPDSLVPVENAEALAEVPMVIWSSPDDVTVPMESNAAALAERVEAAGGDVQLREATGPHGDPSHFDADAIIGFLTRFEPPPRAPS